MSDQMEVFGVAGLGEVTVNVKNYRGLSVEEIADMAIRDIISVKGNPPDIVRQQLMTFRHRLREVLIHYLRMAKEHDRHDVYGMLMKQGQADLAKIIKEL